MSYKSRLLIAVIVLTQITAHADSLKDALDQKYKKHVLALRSPFTHGDQKFDSNGQPLNPATTKDSWLIFGGFYVEKIELSPEMLRMEGPRVGLSGEKKDDKTILVPVGKPVKVEIHLDHPLQSADEVRDILGRVFYLDNEALEHARPEYRRAGDKGLEPTFKIGKKDPSDKETVNAPRAVYTPEPEFSEAARKKRFQGTVLLNVVINEEGNISRIRVQKSLGLGLDENAVESMKSWRFKPATRNGQPVAVEMNIEVSFSLGSSLY
jgi:TonB family protein